MPYSVLLVHALTPLHCGSGQGIEAIDLPIVRERATGLPFIPGSTVKGCLRDAEPDERKRRAIFGPEQEDADKHSGALQVGDARLLLFPVRSLGASFVWATCPLVLRRFCRDLEIAGVNAAPPVPSLGEDQATVADSFALLDRGGARSLVLEELELQPVAGEEARQWAAHIGGTLFPASEAAWRTELSRRLAIIGDESFLYLAKYATEVHAHVRISEATGVVERGALWYQESLPAETVAASLLCASRSRWADYSLTAEQVLPQLHLPDGLQFGGKATTGQGIVRCRKWG